MDLKDYIISAYEDNVKNLPDYPADNGYTSAQLKALFDGRTDKEIKDAINEILKVLKASSYVNGTNDMNTAVGYSSFPVNETGTENTSTGYASLFKNTTGSHNTAVGKVSLYENTAGNYNTAVGMGALQLNKTGNRNVALGYGAGLNELGDNKFYIHNKTVSTNNSEKANSLMYGEFAANADSTTDQKLYINADLTVPAGKTIKVGSTAVALGGESYTKAEADDLFDGKVDKVTGKGLSTNDYDNAEKAEVAKIKDKADKSATYTKAEVDNAISSVITSLDWREAVDSFEDIATTYPTPVDGWTVNVKDTDTTYRYSGTQWVSISANTIPKATSAFDGLMAKEDKEKIDGLVSNATHTGDVTGDTMLTIANNAVTSGKIASLAVTSQKIASNAITNTKISNYTITVDRFALMNSKVLLGTNTEEAAGENELKQLTASEVRAVLNVADGAEANVQPDWEQEDNGADDYIKNKPALFSGSYNDLTDKPTLGTAAGQNTDYFILAPATITDLSSTTKTIAELADNTDYQFGSLTSFTISAVASGYKSGSVAYTASGSATFSAPSSIKWIGADLNASGVFVPVSGKRYNIVFEFDGINVVGMVGAYA